MLRGESYFYACVLMCMCACASGVCVVPVYVQAKINHDRQWKAEVQLTERLTESNAELLKCRKDIQVTKKKVKRIKTGCSAEPSR